MSILFGIDHKDGFILSPWIGDNTKGKMNKNTAAYVTAIGFSIPLCLLSSLCVWVETWLSFILLARIRSRFSRIKPQYFVSRSQPKHIVIILQYINLSDIFVQP